MGEVRNIDTPITGNPDVSDNFRYVDRKFLIDLGGRS